MLLTGILAVPAADGTQEIRAVRGAFDEINCYQMRDENGNYSGYAYEMLQHMKIFAPWRYEYAGFENSSMIFPMNLWVSPSMSLW